MKRRETGRGNLNYRSWLAVKDVGIDEEDFFGFAKSNLSEAFPNPQRIDCPPDSDPRSMAKHPSEAAHAHVSQPHLLFLCFNCYMELLADLKGRNAG